MEDDAYAESLNPRFGAAAADEKYLEDFERNARDDEQELDDWYNRQEKRSREAMINEDTKGLRDEIRAVAAAQNETNRRAKRNLARPKH